MNDSWTGGQYSLLRCLAGLYAVLVFAGPIASGAESSEMFIAVVAILAGSAFAIGFLDRAAALVLVGAWFEWFQGGEFAYVGNLAFPLFFTLHLFLPGGARAPLGALRARGRVDPAGDWSFPRSSHVAAVAACGVLCFAFLARSASLVHGGDFGRFSDQLAGDGSRFFAVVLARLPESSHTVVAAIPVAAAALFLVFVFFRRLHALSWFSLALVQLSAIATFDLGRCAASGLLLQVLAARPGVLFPRRRAEGHPVVFFDGDCGLCHGFVRLVLAEDREGDIVRFAPLQGSTFAEARKRMDAKSLPDSIVLEVPGGTFLTRSDAILRMLAELGGFWRPLSWLARIFPRPLRDAVYDGVAAIRKKIFKAPEGLCPMMPEIYRSRFLP